MVKIYKQPFAHGGDTITIPDASQPDGKMSNADGWTPDYQLPKTDPNYKPVGRQEMNGVFKEVTESLGQVQVQGSATWSANGAPYPVNAQVYHNGKQWLALRANSVAPTEGADWSAVIPQKTVTDAIANKADKATQVIAGTGLSGGGTLAANRTLSVNYGTTAGTAAQGNDSRITGALQKSQVVQTIGASTTNVMSQKAVTDAVNAAAEQPSMTGSATLNGSTNNTIQLTGIVTTLVLEVGDVIRIQYSGYDKLHTVESITNNNLIVVNYEHAGNRGNGGLRLPDTTASATITRIAKWYNAPIGLGQAWVDMTARREKDTTYINSISRSIAVSAISRSYDGLIRLFCNNILIAENGNGASDSNSVFGTIPTRATYKIEGTTLHTWVELR